MTPNEAKRAVPYWDLVKALAEGKTIQVRARSVKASHAQWANTDSPSFHPDYEYRVKPEVKEYFYRVYKGGYMGATRFTSYVDMVNAWTGVAGTGAYVKLTYTEGEIIPKAEAGTL